MSSDPEPKCFMCWIIFMCIATAWIALSTGNGGSIEDIKYKIDDNFREEYRQKMREMG